MGQGDPKHPLAVRADEDRRTARARRRGQELAVTRLEEPTVEIDATLGKKGRIDREGLLEPRDPLVERKAEGAELRVVPARPETEDQPPAGDLVDRARRAWRASPGRGTRSPRRAARADPLGRLGEGGEHRPHLPRPARRPVGVAVEQMVAEPDAVESDGLGGRAIARYSGQRTSRSTSGSWMPTPWAGRAFGEA